MSSRANVICYYKCLWFYSVMATLFFGYVSGASFGRHGRNRRESDRSESKEIEDMRVVASEEIPEISRKDLIGIIQKSQFFQDIFSEQPDPMTIQFGHVCENPNEWEQRYEQRDFKNNHHKGKMRWGNKNGDYGEHYWDLGHAG